MQVSDLAQKLMQGFLSGLICSKQTTAWFESCTVVVADVSGLTAAVYLQAHLQRSMGCEHSTQVVQRHGYQHHPCAPFRDESEHVCGDHACDHQIALLHEDGSRPEEQGCHTHHLQRD